MKEPLEEITIREGVPYPAWYDLLNTLIRDYNERNGEIGKDFEIKMVDPLDATVRNLGHNVMMYGSDISKWPSMMFSKTVPVPTPSKENKVQEVINTLVVLKTWHRASIDRLDEALFRLQGIKQID